MEDKRYEELMAALASVRSKTDFVPEIGLTLGSGLGSLAESMEVECRINYREIAGFPVSTVAGHDGSFLFGKIAGRRVAAMNGRVHYYEGYPMQKVVMPVRLMRLLGAQAVLLTNAAGGINQTFRPGDLMLITDHISQFVPDPLIGPNTEELGPRFTDMTCVYDRELRETVLSSANMQGIDLRQGVYLQTAGPAYETPAEIRMFRNMGADAVGMSTVCEAIAARHCGLRVCGISCITNMAAGILPDQPLSHEEVQETGRKAGQKFENLIEQTIRDISL